MDAISDLRGERVGSLIHAVLHCVRQFPLNTDVTLGVTEMEVTVAADQLIRQSEEFGLDQDDDVGDLMR